jgi:hypothetical protein
VHTAGMSENYPGIIPSIETTKPKVPPAEGGDGTVGAKQLTGARPAQDLREGIPPSPEEDPGRYEGATAGVAADPDAPRAIWNGWLGQIMVMRPSELAGYGVEDGGGTVGAKRLMSVAPTTSQRAQAQITSLNAGYRWQLTVNYSHYFTGISKDPVALSKVSALLRSVSADSLRSTNRGIHVSYSVAGSGTSRRVSTQQLMEIFRLLQIKTEKLPTQYAFAALGDPDQTPDDGR